MKDADIVWLSDINRARSIYAENASLPLHKKKMINFFEGEECMTVKDLLYQTVTAVWGRIDWMAETFDLLSQFPLFLSHFCSEASQRREQVPLYIVKPWNQTRSKDIDITSSLGHIVRLKDKGPRIVCKYISNPVLFQERKTDVRFVFSISSIQPLKIHLYTKHFWPRVAYKPYSLKAEDGVFDEDIHTTVSFYKYQDAISCTDVEYLHSIQAQFPHFSFEMTLSEVARVVRHAVEACVVGGKDANGVFRGFVHQKECEHHTSSCGLYGADIIFTPPPNNYGALGVLLTEINFCPDLRRCLQTDSQFLNGALDRILHNKLAAVTDKEWRVI
eukprot:GCRY01004963.1.p1 GENE.GCRY01004963.1~~GCRY01004963.1.p1  ORF type:complete len:331 (+),score=40.88 GCRY01004963.1:1120-2112(+)